MTKAPPKHDSLADLRRAIDGVDSALVGLLARRFEIVNRVIAVKQAEGLPAAIPARVEDVVARVKAEASRQNVPPAVAEKLWRLLIAETIAYEDESLKPRG